jgi:hypothetical protein
MEQLTTRQVNTLNKWSKYLLPFLALGTLIQTMITQINDDNNVPVTTGTPVNAVNATKTLTISGVVLNGETVSIGDDVYEFSSSTALTVTGDHIPVDINSHTTKSTNLLTIDTNPTSGDTMTIGGKTFTFVPNGTATADGEIDRENSLGDTQLNVRAAINGTDGVNDPHPSVKSTSPFIANVLTLTAIVGGVAGDTIGTTETFTANSNVFSATTLTGGANCSAANAVTALVAAVTASDTEGVSAADGAGDTVVLTADVAGTVGNAITIAETMTNGAFAGGATALSGGVNGTVGVDGEMYKDSSYLYVCTATNTTATKNWRRVSLGSEY